MQPESRAKQRLLSAPVIFFSTMASVGSCAQAGPSFDLTAPVVVRVCGHEPDEAPLLLSPFESIEIRFSEGLDDGSVKPDRVLLVPFEVLADCSLDQDCALLAPDRFARCIQGRCQASVVDAAFMQDVQSNVLSNTRKAMALPALIEPCGSLVTVNPVSPLEANHLYDLVISGRITDLAANPLVDRHGRPGTHLRIVTSDPMATCTRAALVRPAAGLTQAPTNLDAVMIVAQDSVPWDVIDAVILGQAQVPGGGHLSWKQVSCPASALVADMTGADSGMPISLVDDGGRAEGESDGSLQGRVCYEADLTAPLLPEAKYELRAPLPGWDGAPTGRCLDLGSSAWFAAGRGPQQDGGKILQADLVQQGPCATLVLGASAPVEWLVRAWPQGLQGAGDAYWTKMWPGQTASCRFTLDAESVHEPLSLVVTTTDLFGHSDSAGPFILTPQTGPKVMMTEVLANPAGNEPDQEFVELLNIGEDTVSLSGWSLATEPDGGDGQVISEGLLEPGRFALLVGPGYDPFSGSDVPVAAGTLVIHLERNLSGNGLSNSGEALYLLNGFGQPVSAYDHPISVSSGRYNGVSVERTSRQLCVSGPAWQPNPEGRSSPGAPNDSWR